MSKSSRLRSLRILAGSIPRGMVKEHCDNLRQQPNNCGKAQHAWVNPRRQRKKIVHRILSGTSNLLDQ